MCYASEYLLFALIEKEPNSGVPKHRLWPYAYRQLPYLSANPVGTAPVSRLITSWPNALKCSIQPLNSGVLGSVIADWFIIFVFIFSFLMFYAAGFSRACITVKVLCLLRVKYI